MFEINETLLLSLICHKNLCLISNFTGRRKLLFFLQKRIPLLMRKVRTRSIIYCTEKFGILEHVLLDRPTMRSLIFHCRYQSQRFGGITTHRDNRPLMSYFDVLYIIGITSKHVTGHELHDASLSCRLTLLGTEINSSFILQSIGY